jgi:hypothetical protein
MGDVGDCIFVVGNIYGPLSQSRMKRLKMRFVVKWKLSKTKIPVDVNIAWPWIRRKPGVE